MNNLHMRAALTLGLLALAAGPVHAEEYVVEPIVDNVATTSADGQEYTQAELDQLLAPIALYPDSLLSQVLVAATYPLEVVEAARWSRQNPQLEGEDAVAAVAARDWDPSVKALVAFPEILARMDEDLDWTRNLGDAMLYQEAQVMDSIQFLRARADAEGNLETTEYARVIREEKTIIIEPARTHVVHVPYYDPHVVYGTWWWPAYPPVVWAAPSYYYHGHPGYYWGSGVRLSSGFFFSSFYWPQRSVVIVHAPRYYHAPRYRSARHYYTPGERWKHNPRHRRGVAYRHKDVRQRYDQPRLRAGPSTRWPIDSGTRATRNADGGSRLTGTRRDYREDRDGAWRDGNSRGTRDSRAARPTDRASGSVREAADRSPQQATNRTARDAEGARLSAGPRTVRPSVSRTGERLRDTRATTRSQQRAQRTVSPTQRPATVTRRAVSPSQRTASAPRARASTPQAGVSAPRARASAPRVSAPAARSTVSSSPRSTSRAPQARSQGRSGASAAPAPAPPARAGSSRSSGRGAESRAAPKADRDKGEANSRRGQSGRNGRRFD